MKTPTLMQAGRVRVADVVERDRLRPVSEAGVQSLIASIEAVGVMKDPIHVRKRKDGQLQLIAGGHRLEAARRLGWDEIEARVWTDVTDDWARLMEIDDNLAGAEMNALDTAVFLATRKELYERMNPQTKRGVAGAMGRWDATEPSSVAFATATAEKFGLTERQVRKIVAAGAALGPGEVAQLRSAPKPVTLKDLTEIAKIGAPAERYSVVGMLAEGSSKSAADARKLLRLQRDGVPAPRDPADVGFLAISAAWSRASRAARRRFVDELRAELTELLDLPQEG